MGVAQMLRLCSAQSTHYINTQLQCKSTNIRFIQISTAFAVFVCIVFMLKSNQRANEWAKEEQLYRSALRVCPNNAKVYYNIGRLASQNGNDTTAMNHYKYAIELYPNYDAALMNLGNLYRTQHQLDLAEQLIQKSIEIT